MSFQTTVNLQQAPAVAGDFASANPRANVLAGEGALVADTGGCVVGRFAWLSSEKAKNSGTGSPAGFVHREMNALITTFLACGVSAQRGGFSMNSRVSSSSHWSYLRGGLAMP